MLRNFFIQVLNISYLADGLCYKPGVVSFRDVLYLAHDVGLQWKTLCRILLGAKEVEHIDHDEKTLYDKCYTLLNRWKKSQASDATYAALGMALMHEDLQAEELCAKYCLQFGKGICMIDASISTSDRLEVNAILVE